MSPARCLTALLRSRALSGFAPDARSLDRFDMRVFVPIHYLTFRQRQGLNPAHVNEKTVGRGKLRRHSSQMTTDPQAMQIHVMKLPL
jgi:hypothetical protein